jgi:ferric-dicitrate binding protein FerR (iron transport regulator)
MGASDRRRRAATEAARWWVVLQDASCTTADRDQFVTWMRESAVHVGEMLRMARTQHGLQQFQGWSSIPSAWDSGSEVVPIDPARP